MKKTKNILVCPLDWGLGHATRLVPVIDLLLKKEVNVIIGADKRPMDYLQKRFPSCKFIVIPGYSPKYPVNGSMLMTMIRSYPKMLAAAKKANRQLQSIIEEKDIDAVISDNRYELHADRIPSIFITHQLNIQTPGISKIGSPLIKRMINNYVRKYDELWIPDFEDLPNLSGELSHIKKMPHDNSHFIGPLSRFSLVTITPDPSQKTELLIILSGPEPQRTLLEEKLINQVIKTDLKTIILQGKPEEETEQLIENIKLIPHLSDEQMAALIKRADFLICRPGYSTIMDLSVLGKKAIFIPTPGQTEQEYLARRFKQEGVFYSASQDEFDLNQAIQELHGFSGISLNQDSNLLENRIDNLISRI